MAEEAPEVARPGELAAVEAEDWPMAVQGDAAVEPPPGVGEQEGLPEPQKGAEEHSSAEPVAVEPSPDSADEEAREDAAHQEAPADLPSAALPSAEREEHPQGQVDEEEPAPPEESVASDHPPTASPASVVPDARHPIDCPDVPPTHSLPSLLASRLSPVIPAPLSRR